MRRTYRPECSLLIATMAAWACTSPVSAQDEPVAAKVDGQHSSIRDVGGMFGLDALRVARKRLELVEQTHHVPILIETVDSLQGQTIDEVAERRYDQNGKQGIYILLAKQEHRMSQILVPDRLTAQFTKSARLEIRNAFLDKFKEKNFGAGLMGGIEVIDATLAKAEPAPASPSTLKPDVASRIDSPLIERNQVRLTLEGARRVIAGAEAKAAAMGLRDNIAVVDDGGHPIAFARMDGARPASVYTAMTKAISAATFRQATGPIPANVERPDPLLNLSMQNAAAVGGGKITTLQGGVPILIDGQVIGAVGVGGGTGEQDAEVAKAGIAAFQEGLKEVPEPRK